ncbi:uncharacterized protein LOC117899053 isoform X1 [Drosophila subobscura]|uniref:uncharacterized protein LOC117899053 isoform X1 n=1 Tax=Drosophila subobscura TaxID=7241 RepID=UPI00155A1851|nr:uncharacterized protein LOC117899053 isoform X1 [Drosophila subobscura]
MNCKLRRLDMLRSGQLSDCEVCVWYSDGSRRCHRVFRCHEILLVSASAEFGRLCRSPCFESNNRVIDLDDASPEAYEALIRYIYTYEVCNAINLEICGELMRLAMKHRMYDFIDCYLTKLSAQEWPMEVVLQIFHLANQHNSPIIMELVANKILPIVTKVLNENSFLRLNVRELKALMIILKEEEILPDKQLLEALKKYQVANNLRYCDMERFQQFVEVARIFDDIYFAVDGSLSIRKGTNETDPDCTCAAVQKSPSHLLGSGSNKLDAAGCSQQEVTQDNDPMASCSKQSNHSICPKVLLKQKSNLDCGCGVVQEKNNPMASSSKQLNYSSCCEDVVQHKNYLVCGSEVLHKVDSCPVVVVQQHNDPVASSSTQSNLSKGSRGILKQDADLDCVCAIENKADSSCVAVPKQNDLDCGCGVEQKTENSCAVVAKQLNDPMASFYKQSNPSNSSQVVWRQDTNMDCGCGVVQKAKNLPIVAVKQENPTANSFKQSKCSSKVVLKQDINLACGGGASRKAENSSIVVVKQHKLAGAYGCGVSSSIQHQTSHSKSRSRVGRSTSAGCGCGVDTQKSKTKSSKN